MYKIIKDTREKNGWDFEINDKCVGVEVKGLKTGDYTMEGCEDTVCVERKASAEELAINLGSKWKTFQKELERMKEFRFAYIICEFNINDMLEYPFNTGMYYRLKKQKEKNPKIRLPQIRGAFLLKKMTQISMFYSNIKVIYAGTPEIAKRVALNIFYEASKYDK